MSAAARSMIRCTAFALLALVSGLGAQAPERQVAYADRLLVKLVEGSGAVLQDGELRSRKAVDLTAVARVFARAERAERCIDQPLELLDRWHREADERLPAGAERPGHLGLWFRLHCGTAAMADALRDELTSLEHVQEAERERIPFPAGPALQGGSGDDIPPVTPDLTHLQAWLGAPPDGFGMSLAHRVAGARGQRLRIYHAEAAWRDDHEDLGSIDASSYIVPPAAGIPYLQVEHGTAVLGVWAAQRNGFGMTGAVDAADVRLVSWVTTNGIANSITTVAADSRPGDVLGLIALYDLEMVQLEDYVPCEYVRLDFDAILTATTQGLIVVEAAGNGDNDLDDPRFGRRFDRTSRDSGAIMVGATDGPALQRASFSNYGSRIDVNGWGDQVATVGFGTWIRVGGDQRQAYTERGAGTSGATAIVSALVGQLAGAANLQLGRPLTPAETRALVRAHGTPVPGQIGVRPDAAAVLEALGLPDGLQVDRHEVDIGTSVQVTASGSVGGTSVVVAAFELGEFDLGLNRPLLLDPATLLTVGAFVRGDGTAMFPIAVPNAPIVRGAQLYLQALSAESGGTFSMSSAAEIFVP